MSIVNKCDKCSRVSPETNPLHEHYCIEEAIKLSIRIHVARDKYKYSGEWNEGHVCNNCLMKMLRAIVDSSVIKEQ